MYSILAIQDLTSGGSVFAKIYTVSFTNFDGSISFKTKILNNVGSNVYTFYPNGVEITLDSEDFLSEFFEKYTINFVSADWGLFYFIPNHIFSSVDICVVSSDDSIETINYLELNVGKYFAFSGTYDSTYNIFYHVLSSGTKFYDSFEDLLLDKKESYAYRIGVLSSYKGVFDYINYHYFGGYYQGYISRSAPCYDVSSCCSDLDFSPIVTLLGG